MACKDGRKDRKCLFNNALNTLYLWLYGIGHMVEREREMIYLSLHSTHFIYSYMASNIWLRTILIVRKETRCRHIGYSYRLTARVLLYAPSHRQDNTYHSLCYTSRGALAGTRTTHIARQETYNRHTGYSFKLSVTVLLYETNPETG